MDILKGDRRTVMVHQILSRLFAGNIERLSTRQAQIFDSIVGYDDIKDTFSRSLNSKEPVLLVGPPGQAKTWTMTITYDNGTTVTPPLGSALYKAHNYEPKELELGNSTWTMYNSTSGSVSKITFHSGIVDGS